MPPTCVHVLTHRCNNKKNTHRSLLRELENVRSRLKQSEDEKRAFESKYLQAQVHFTSPSIRVQANSTVFFYTSVHSVLLYKVCIWQAQISPLEQQLRQQYNEFQQVPSIPAVLPNPLSGKVEKQLTRSSQFQTS